MRFGRIVSRPDEEAGSREVVPVLYGERMEHVSLLAELLAERQDDLIEAAAADVGFTWKDSKLEVETTVDRLLKFSDLAETLGQRTPLGGGEREEVAVVCSYNGSAWLNIIIASVYLVGNRLRVKFSSRCPTILEVTEAIYREVLPDWVVFDRRPGKEFMERVLAEPAVKAVVLFGSDTHALSCEGAVAESQKKFIFEGPGKDPFIVLRGAEMEEAVEALAEAKYMYAGQTCTAPERVYVHRSRYREFLDCFVERTEKLVLGDPPDPATDISPLGSPLAVENISVQLRDVSSKGGRVLCGGAVRGDLVEPTIIADAHHGMLGMQEETFGPVSFVMPFDSEEEALRLARDNRFGLRATVYGGEDEAERVAEALRGEPYCHPVGSFLFGRYGTVSVNERRSESWEEALVTMPIGGYGHSGWVWESDEGRFVLKQGPKLLSLETSSGGLGGFGQREPKGV